MPTKTIAVSAILSLVKTVAVSASLGKALLQTVSADAVIASGCAVLVSAELVSGTPLQIEISALVILEQVVEQTVIPIPVFDEPPIIITGGVGAILYKALDEQLKWLEIPTDWAGKRYVLTIAGGVPTWGETNDASEVFGGWGNSWGTSWGF